MDIYTLPVILIQPFNFTPGKTKGKGEDVFREVAWSMSTVLWGVTEWGEKSQLPWEAMLEAW